MALTNNGMEVVVKDAPTGFTPQPSTPFNDWQWKYGATFTVTTASVQNPDPATTFTALEAALQALVDAKIADFEATAGNPTVFARWRTAKITTGDKYEQDPEVYTCSVDIFCKTLL